MKTQRIISYQEDFFDGASEVVDDGGRISLICDSEPTPKKDIAGILKGLMLTDGMEVFEVNGDIHFHSIEKGDKFLFDLAAIALALNIPLGKEYVEGDDDEDLYYGSSDSFPGVKFIFSSKPVDHIGDE